MWNKLSSGQSKRCGPSAAGEEEGADEAVWGESPAKLQENFVAVAVAFAVVIVWYFPCSSLLVAAAQQERNKEKTKNQKNPKTERPKDLAKSLMEMQCSFNWSCSHEEKEEQLQL